MPTFQAIQTVTLTSTQTGITFSSIPATYDDLMLWVSARSDNGTWGGFEVKPNNSRTADRRRMGGANNGTFSEGTNHMVDAMYWNIPGDTTNWYGGGWAYFANYTHPTNRKTYWADSIRPNNAGDTALLFNLVWSNQTGAITSIVLETPTIVALSGWLAGSTATLYGIKNG